MLEWDDRDLHIVIDHPNRNDIDVQLHQKYIFESKIINYVPQKTSLWDILKDSGIFVSKKEARKNWKYGDLHEGFNRFEGVGKLRRNLYILKLPEDLPK